MGKYVFVYKGGGGMPETEEEQQSVMAAWGAWFETLGSAVADMGNPFAGSSSVSPDGSVGNGGGAGLTGYSIITADSLQDATGSAKGCPILARGGSVEVYEAVEM
ncbi:MAG: hypothetical protein M3P15_03430 [Actinomycetota bacterium]|nr:hypothetical protein [Actinomycetota bacterium]